jgi:choline dehydrogenase-like flavoprotein
MAQNSTQSKWLEMVSLLLTSLHKLFCLLSIGNQCSHVSRATKEVILSAGSIGSPQILFHSGFGDAQELKFVGIEPLVNLPSLGKNLTDHPFLLVDFSAENTEAKFIGF